MRIRAGDRLRLVPAGGFSGRSRFCYRLETQTSDESSGFFRGMSLLRGGLELERM